MTLWMGEETSETKTGTKYKQIHHEIKRKIRKREKNLAQQQLS